MKGAVPGASFFAGNAAFVTGEGKLTGFDFSGKIDIVQSWSVSFNQEDEFNEKLDKHVADLKGRCNRNRKSASLS